MTSRDGTYENILCEVINKNKVIFIGLDCPTFKFFFIQNIAISLQIFEKVTTNYKFCRV